MRVLLMLGAVAVLHTSTAVGQGPTASSLRIRPGSAAPRIAAPAPPEIRASTQMPDSLRPQTNWQRGFWTGIGIGAILGTLIATSDVEGDPSLGNRAYHAFLFTGLIGLPLGVIGGLIGDASKKPVSPAPASP